MPIRLAHSPVERGEVRSRIRQPPEVWAQANPNSLLINGYTWERCCQGIPEQDAADQILRFLSRWSIHRNNSVFICQNPSFDRGFFSQLIDPQIQEQHQWPYHWLDLASMFWALEVHRARLAGTPLPSLSSLSKDQIAAAHQLPPETRPHTALSGVNHLILCYGQVVGFGSPVPLPI
jgi:oligoribonuclease